MEQQQQQETTTSLKRHNNESYDNEQEDNLNNKKKQKASTSSKQELFSATSNSELHYDDHYYSTTTTTLDPTKFEEWTREQVCALLILPEKQGGVPLSVEKVQPLYNAEFDGSFIDNIVQDINRYGVIDAQTMLTDQFKDGGIAISFQLWCTLDNVVNWVDDLLKSRFYHLWHYEKIKEKLGTILTQSELDLVTIRDGVVESSDVNCSAKISDWVKSFHITISKQNCLEVSGLSLQQLSTTLDEDIANFLIEQTRLTTTQIYLKVEQFYESARKTMCGYFNTPLPFNLIEHLVNSVSIPENTLTFGQPTSFDSKYYSVPLPMKNNDFVKNVLPFLPKFHKGFECDNELSKIGKTRSCCLLLGSSGVGKTSAINRLMCSVPGIYLSCILEYEMVDPMISDELMRNAHATLISKTLIELYGCVHQVVQMVFIARLLYILKLIQHAKQNNNVFKDFGGILPYLAYMQVGKSASSSVKVFYQLLPYCYCEVMAFRNCTNQLVEKVILELNTNADHFGISEKVSTFIVAIDEANVFANSSSYNKFSKLVSSGGGGGVGGGNTRSLLSIFAQGAALVNNFSSLLFAGTNFTADIGHIVQSSMLKTEAKLDIRHIFNFGNIPSTDIIEFLKLHINVPIEEQDELKQLYKFKNVRRRALTYAIEILEDNIVDSLIDSIHKFIQSQSYRDFEIMYNREEEFTQNQIREALVSYITHYHFPFLGKSFTVTNGSCAHFLLFSNIDSPKSIVVDHLTKKCTTWTFEAADTIGVQVAMKLYGKIMGIKEDQEILEHAVNQKIKLILNNGCSPSNNVELEHVAKLKLWVLHVTNVKGIH